MADPYVAEIRMVGFNFAPRGWAQCDGQIISIAQNTALFSLLGTTYGGNGTVNFALPDLRGRVTIGQFQGLGLSPYDLGQTGGEENHALTTAEMPAHNHGGTLLANSAAGTATTPTGNVPSTPSGVNPRFATMYSNAATDTTNATAIATAGNGQSHPNIMPYQCVNFVIALQGVFPPRS
jgi:microcystin-dependent protein